MGSGVPGVEGTRVRSHFTQPCEQFSNRMHEFFPFDAPSPAHSGIGPGGPQAILQTLLVSLAESFDQGGSKALSIDNLLLNIDMYGASYRRPLATMVEWRLPSLPLSLHRRRPLMR